jgi:hypothetical protein
LLAVDTRTPELAIAALQHCTAALRFASVKLLTDRAIEAPGVEVVRVPTVISSAAYSHQVQKGLLAHVKTPHVLIAQWDGFVVDPGSWDPGFLDWDYLGAPWGGRPGDDHRVGNGGFSLRSRRLLVALGDPALAPQHPEDVAICVTHREALEKRHGIRFAPLALAERFAYESLRPAAPTFGFHGAVNLADMITSDELAACLTRLPDDWFAGRDAFKLARRLLAVGDRANARQLLSRRRTAGAADLRTLLMQVRAGLGSRVAAREPRR